MSVYKFEPTEIEVACGVTAEAVADMLTKVAVRSGPSGYLRVILPILTPPSLCGAVTRAALGHDRYEFGGLNYLGMPVYIERP